MDLGSKMLKPFRNILFRVGLDSGRLTPRDCPFFRSACVSKLQSGLADKIQWPDLACFGTAPLLFKDKPESIQSLKSMASRGPNEGSTDEPAMLFALIPGVPA